MANLTTRIATLRNSQGQTVTVDLIYDSVTFTVITVVVTNNWNDSSYTFSVTNQANPTVDTFTQTVLALATLTFTVLVVWHLNSDLSMQNQWQFQG